MQARIGKMAKMFPMMIGMGFMIVLTTFIIGYFNSQIAADYFSNTKLIRETTMMSQRMSMASIGLWMPPLKFLGIGLILGGIIMALRVIIDQLKAAGNKVLSNVPVGSRPSLPPTPWYGAMMPMVMMAGELIFLTSFLIGIWLSGIARTIFANPMPTVDAAGPGSAILTGIQTIHAVEGWLVPFKFLAISTEFLAIAMGLATIIYILNNQTNMLARILNPSHAIAK